MSPDTLLRRHIADVCHQIRELGTEHCVVLVELAAGEDSAGCLVLSQGDGPTVAISLVPAEQGRRLLRAWFDPALIAEYDNRHGPGYSRTLVIAGGEVAVAHVNGTGIN